MEAVRHFTALESLSALLSCFLLVNGTLRVCECVCFLAVPLGDVSAPSSSPLPLNTGCVMVNVGAACERKIKGEDREKESNYNTLITIIPIIYTFTITIATISVPSPPQSSPIFITAVITVCHHYLLSSPTQPLPSTPPPLPPPPQLLYPLCKRNAGEETQPHFHFTLNDLGSMYVLGRCRVRLLYIITTYLYNISLLLYLVVIKCCIFRAKQ